MLILFEDLSQSLQVLYRYIYIKTLSDGKGLNLHQFILHIAQSDLFRMAQSSQPVRIRVHHVELVMTAQIIVLMSGRKAVTRVQLGAWMTISAHALSRATGSVEARIPRSGTMAASL